MIQPHAVKKILARHMLTEGYDIILDVDKSEGCRFVDACSGERYLDFFAMYASMAVGYNHPRLLKIEPQLGRLAVNKPSNSDVYTTAMAEFVETFSRLAIPDSLPHAFFIDGGALAVENALKTAFDWKVRKNRMAGRRREAGGQVIHFRQAFHGRSGYTLSLTNTHDLRKTKFFPTFDWPRVVNPKLKFPLNQENLARVHALEKQALREIHRAIETQGEDLAALIIEPIQGEGGDNHFRPEFFHALRQICDDHEILLIFDEVQTGVGLTGHFWAYEHFGVRPDILTFGKKTQVCGILASRRIDEVGCHVFRERSRINSTFGGNLVDMVRCRQILRIIEEEQLVANACRQGKKLLAGLQALEAEVPDTVSNARGRGLMCAIDVPDGLVRDQVIKACFLEKLLLVGCGRRSIRFRPHLIVGDEEIEQCLHILRQVLARGEYRNLQIHRDPCLGGGT